MELPESKILISQCNQLLEAGLIRPSYNAIHKIFIAAAEKSLEKKNNPLAKTKVKKSRKKTPEKWFDIECQKLKDKSKQLANLKHQNPWDKSLLNKHREILKQYKKICSFKKYSFWINEVSKLENSLNNHEDFWELWKKTGENKNNQTKIPVVNGKQWEEHFKSLFKKHEGNIEELMTKRGMNINQELNKQFSMSELQDAISKLKNNKAVGPDRIPNEFIKHATKEIKGLILKFLNLNLKNGITAEKMCEDFISLIHKEGKKDNPDNYRGICIANALLKNLCSIMEKRLKDFCNKNKLIDKEQIGFQENSRTSDHILTMKSIVNKYVTDQKGKNYTLVL